VIRAMPACKVFPVRLGLRVRRVFKALPVLLGRAELWELRGCRAFLVRQARTELPVLWGHRGLLGLLDNRALSAHKDCREFREQMDRRGWRIRVRISRA
jgi:hypothetical protein